MDWRRIKNVYKVTADLQNGNNSTLVVFSHSPENALKKAKDFYLKTMHTEIQKLVCVDCIYKDVIY